jgi:hypothetical protein
MPDQTDKSYNNIKTVLCYRPFLCELREKMNDKPSY